MLKDLYWKNVGKVRGGNPERYLCCELIDGKYDNVFYGPFEVSRLESNTGEPMNTLLTVSPRSLGSVVLKCDTTGHVSERYEAYRLYGISLGWRSCSKRDHEGSVMYGVGVSEGFMINYSVQDVTLDVALAYVGRPGQFIYRFTVMGAERAYEWNNGHWEPVTP